MSALDNVVSLAHARNPNQSDNIEAAKELAGLRAELAEAVELLHDLAGLKQLAEDFCKQYYPAVLHRTALFLAKHSQPVSNTRVVTNYETDDPLDDGLDDSIIGALP